MRKYSLQKRLVLLGTTIGLSAAVLSTKYSKTILNSDVQYTEQDDVNNQYLKDQLYNLSLVDDNQELYLPIDSNMRKIITTKNNKGIEEPVTMEDFRNIKELEIDNITTEEYYCLFFFENLEYLKISNSTIDLKVLENNINLNKLILENVCFSSSKDIPNSVSNIELLSSTCLDDEFRVPYNVNNLDIVMSYVNNISLKNPKRLKRLCYYSDSVLDMDALVDCNLHILNIINSPNIKNASKLSSIKCDMLFLDDSASIWLNYDMYKEIESNFFFFDRPFYLEDNIKKLDEISNELNNINDNSKLEEIEDYVLDRLEYDKAIFINPILPKYYNTFPILSIINSDKGICVNYASLFQALANRSDIDSYLMSNDNHAWNKVYIDGNGLYIDTTFMDESEEAKKIYDCFIADLGHIANNEPVINYIKSNDIGYVSEEYKDSFIADKHIDLTSLRIMISKYQDKMLLLLLAYMTHNLIELKRDKKRKERVKKRKRSLH